MTTDTTRDARRRLPVYRRHRSSRLGRAWPKPCNLLGRAGGFAAQDELWGFVADGLVMIWSPETDEWERMRTLMAQYADAPMDLGDASLVSAAERTGLSRIFTLDRHFHAFRINGALPFEVVP